MRKNAMTLVFCMVTGFQLSASTGSAADAVISEIPDAELVGSARLTFLFWDVYDAFLFAPKGIWSGAGPFALKLTYLRDLKGAAIVARTIDEIEGQGFTDRDLLEKWRAQLSAIIPDVSNGVSLTGVRRADGTILFYRGHALIGRVEDPLLADRFFGVWLDRKTSQPALRAQLLGRPS